MLPPKGAHSGPARQTRVIPVGKTPASPPEKRAETKEKPVPKAKPERLPPSDKPIPREGLPAIRYRINVARKRPDKVPRVSKSEQRKLDRDAATDRLVQLTREVPSLTACFIGIKGAAATTTSTVHAASVLGDSTRTVLVVTDFNPASGTSALRLGLDYDQTITLRGFRSDMDSMGSFRSFVKKVSTTRYGVRAISADSIIGGDQHLTGDDARKMLEVIKENSQFHYIDTANDITEDVTLAVVGMSDVIVFTANVAVRDSLRQLAISMETLRQHGFADKVDRSVVLISNIPKKGELDNYRKYLNYVDMGHRVVREIPFGGQFLGIPHDPVIMLDTEVDLGALAWRTYQDYLFTNIAIFEQHPAVVVSSSLSRT